MQRIDYANKSFNRFNSSYKTPRTVCPVEKRIMTTVGTVALIVFAFSPLFIK